MNQQSKQPKQIKNVLIINYDAEHSSVENNRGQEAIFIATIDMWLQAVPEVQFSTFLPCDPRFLKKFPSLKFLGDNKKVFQKRYSIGISLSTTVLFIRALLWSALHKWFKADMRFLLNQKRLKAFAETDLIIHMGADNYSEDIEKWALIEHSKDILLGSLLGKPVVIWAESPGPFISRFGKWLARYTLNKASLITLRGEIAFEHLQKLGVNKPPMYLTADPAFLLRPAPLARVADIFKAENINTGGPLIGVTLSVASLTSNIGKKNWLMMVGATVYHFAEYMLPYSIYRLMVQTMRKARPSAKWHSGIKDTANLVKLLDYLTGELGANVVLIPHVQDRKEALFSEKEFSHQLISNAKRPDMIHIIGFDYSSEELKGIIGQCDMFIGQKMHACIAALSQAVPTIALAYASKFYSIMRICGQEKYTFDSYDVDKVTKAAAEIWQKRPEIRAELEKNMINVRKMAFDNVELVLKTIK